MLQNMGELVKVDRVSMVDSQWSDYGPRSPLQVVTLDNTGTCACVHTVTPGDTCQSIAYQKGVTVQAILRFNPSLNADCSNLVDDQVSVLTLIQL